MYNDEDMRQAYKEGYEKGIADGGYAVLGDGWRDVRKELPPAGELVLLYFSGGNYVQAEYFSYYPKGHENEEKYLQRGWKFDAEEIGIGEEAIAWRPLPDPPSFA